ncbi:hypothetical protein [Nocardioides mangrovi]|uniref:Uncharacterized protein n=1 Tax=Nocardioides mangrovi TaxID=2874580 RepID=A0ABS7UL01_9ACTN|nr:hypothetical protein [Nocardioides mangrovi]MBZ5741252.1 hypothetical protein [Nocardioides mangrovi]
MTQLTSGDPLSAWESALKPARGYARVQFLSALLSRRPELVGVYEPADVATEAIRWTA